MTFRDTSGTRLADVVVRLAALVGASWLIVRIRIPAADYEILGGVVRVYPVSIWSDPRMFFVVPVGAVLLVGFLLSPLLSRKPRFRRYITTSVVTTSLILGFLAVVAMWGAAWGSTRSAVEGTRTAAHAAWPAHISSKGTEVPDKAARPGDYVISDSTGSPCIFRVTRDGDDRVLSLNCGGREVSAA